MGWPWSSSSSSGAVATNITPESPPQSQPQPQPPPPPPPPPPPQPQSQPTPTEPTPDPNADFYAAHPHLAPQPSSTSSSTASQPSSSEKPSPLDPTYPTTLSCRAAFDSAFYCQSLGGKFNDIYRHGTLQSCSTQWADWRFCMRVRVKPQAEKEALIRERYREKEERIRSGPNSEQIWERRGPGEEVREPFGRAGEVGVDG